MESQIKIENQKLIYNQEDSFFRCQICGLIPFIGIDYQNKRIFIEKKCENNHISKTEINSYLKSLNSFNFNCFKCKKQKNDLYYWPEINKFFCNYCKEKIPEKCVSLKKFDSICPKSLIDFSCYCLKCQKNQCIYCDCNHEKEKKYYNSCIINSNEIQYYKKNLNKSKDLVKRIEKVSICLSKQIYDKLNFLEKCVKEFKEKNNSLILLSEKLIECYENHVSTKNINYQVIQNVRNVLNFKLNLKSSNSVHEHFEILKNYLILENSKLNIDLKVYQESKLNNLHFQNINNNNSQLNNKSFDSLHLNYFINNNLNDLPYNSRKNLSPNNISKIITLSPSSSSNYDPHNISLQSLPLLYNFLEKERSQTIENSIIEQNKFNNQNTSFDRNILKKNLNQNCQNYNKNLQIYNYNIDFSLKVPNTNLNNNLKNEEKKEKEKSNQNNINNINNISSIESINNENQKKNSETNDTIENEIKKLNLMNKKEKSSEISKIETENNNANITYLIEKEIIKINLLKEKEKSEKIISDFQIENPNEKINDTIEKEIEKLNLKKEKEKEKIEQKNENQNENDIQENNNKIIKKLNLLKEKTLETISLSSESESELLENKVKMIQLKKPIIKKENFNRIENEKENENENKNKSQIFKISKTQNYKDILLKEIFDKYPPIYEKDKIISTVYNYLYDDNSFYSGEMNMLTKEREGRGILIDPDGSYRIGYFHNNNQEKNGIWHYVDKLFYYEGEFYNDLQQGYGECYWDNGDYFFGLFHNSELIHGDYHYKNGIIYRGSFKNGKKNGIGCVFDPVKKIWEEKEFKNDILVENNKKKGNK